jgi:regulator of sigma E protease
VSLAVSYVLAFLAFAVLIILHEFGHFAAAKAVGMRVEKFSLFFGPMIVKRQIGETLYGIGVIPLGGFVKISGMAPDDEFGEESGSRLPTTSTALRSGAAAGSDPRAYVNMPVWKRVVVIAAGPAMNLLVAFLILTALFLHFGAATNGPRQIVGVIKNTPAAAALKTGDRLISVDGAKSDAGIERAVNASHCADKPVNGCVASPAVTILVRRHGKLVQVSLHPHYNTSARRPLVGFQYGYYSIVVPTGPVSAARYGIKAMWEEASATVHAITHIFQAKERTQLHSVVGAYKITEEAVSTSAEEGLEVMAAISLALAVINLFPFLPLDGGHIFWAMAEKVTGRKISLATIERASIVGIVLVLLIFIVGLSNDVHGLLNGGIKLH